MSWFGQKTTLTMASGLADHVPRGTVIALTGGSGAGKSFVVVRATQTVLTLVPFRWWHKVPWWAAFIVGAMLGATASQLFRWL